MSTLSVLLAALDVAARDNSNPDKTVASGFINSLNNASSDLRNATPNVDTAGAFAAWDRSVRGIETLMGTAGPPLDSGNIHASQARTNTAIARARVARVAPEVIAAVEAKPGAYSITLSATSRAASAQAALDAEMADAQQYLDYLAVV